MSEEGRRSEKQIRKDLNANAKDVLDSHASERGLLRIKVITEIIKAEVLLDIREHLDSLVECAVLDKL